MKTNMKVFKNINNTNLIIIVLVILNITVLSILFFSNNTTDLAENNIREYRQQNAYEFFRKDLNLDDDQLMKIRENGQIHSREKRKYSDEIKLLKRELYHEIFAEGELDQTKIDNLIDSISGKYKHLERIQFNHFYNIKNICSPEQAEKFNILMDDMVEMMNSRNHGGSRERMRHRERNKRN